MQVARHILGAQVHRTAVGRMDTLTASNGKILPVQFHWSVRTLSPHIDGYRRKAVRSGISGRDGATSTESTRKGNVFPQDGSLSSVAATIVFNGHVIRGIRPDRHLILVPALEVLYGNGIPICGIAAPCIHLIVRFPRIRSRRIRCQGHTSR